MWIHYNKRHDQIKIRLNLLSLNQSVIFHSFFSFLKTLFVTQSVSLSHSLIVTVFPQTPSYNYDLPLNYNINSFFSFHLLLFTCDLQLIFSLFPLNHASLIIFLTRFYSFPFFPWNKHRYTHLLKQYKHLS